MRILVTGGFGYLGAHVALRFAERGVDVRVLDRTMTAEHTAWAIEHGLETVRGDITDAASIEGVFGDVDLVVHTAALNQPSCAADPALALRVNALGTRNLLAAADSKVGRFIYLSTIHVYGHGIAGQTVDEHWPARPTSDYGITKLAGEGYCHKFAVARGIQAAILRPANGFGPPVFASADCWMLAVNDFCRSAYATGEIVLKSPGAQRRDFLALSDTVRAIETLADARDIGDDAAGAGVYNVGAGLSLTIRGLALEAAEVCAEVYGRDVAVRMPEGSDALPDESAVDYRYERIAALGFAPATDLRAGIAAVAHFVAEGECTSGSRPPGRS